MNPESIKVSKSHGFQDVEITQLGEYTIIGGAKLPEFSFSSFFPRDYNPSYCEYKNLPNPWDAVNYIGDWMKSGRPIRMTITGTPINKAVTIREFSYEAERAGHVGDIFYDITLKEYTFVEFRRLSQMSSDTSDSVSVSENTARPDTSVPDSTYDVKSGDTLWAIAQRMYGDGDRWREIYDANADLIGPNPNRITPGQTLVIP